MIKKLYGLMDRSEKKNYSMLLAMEVNSYLHKIYSSMKRTVPLKPSRVTPKMLILKHASLGATKMWEFRLNKKEEAAAGNVGNIVVVTRGLGTEPVRKQRALFIAAEFYVYHAFANHPDPAYFNSIKCQNQYIDMARKMLGRENAHDIRDRAVRYVIGEIKEHKLAQYRHKGWFVSIAKLKKHHPQIAEILGSSEATFRDMLSKQHQVFTPEMLTQEEDLVRKEIEDISFLAKLLSERNRAGIPQKMKQLMKIHIDNINLFRRLLTRIKDNLESWVVVDREEHSVLRKKSLVSPSELHKLLLAEAEAEQVDINKVHIIFEHFKKEKINILRDLELIDNLGASAR